MAWNNHVKKAHVHCHPLSTATLNNQRVNQQEIPKASLQSMKSERRSRQIFVKSSTSHGNPHEIPWKIPLNQYEVQKKNLWNSTKSHGKSYEIPIFSHWVGPRTSWVSPLVVNSASCARNSMTTKEPGEFMGVPSDFMGFPWIWWDFP